MEIVYYKTLEKKFNIDIDKLVDLILSDNKEEIERGNIDLIGLVWEFVANEFTYFQELGFDGDYDSLEYFENSDEEKELITIINKKLIEKCKNLNKLN